MTGVYRWEHAEPGTRHHHYTIRRDTTPVARLTIDDSIPFHPWHLSNICDVFTNIERSNQPRTLRAAPGDACG